jgi:hypothetical protein
MWQYSGYLGTHSTCYKLMFPLRLLHLLNTPIPGHNTDFTEDIQQVSTFHPVLPIAVYGFTYWAVCNLRAHGKPCVFCTRRPILSLRRISLWLLVYSPTDDVNNSHYTISGKWQAWARCGTERSCLYSRPHFGIFKNLVSGRDVNVGPQKHETGVVIIQLDFKTFCGRLVKLLVFASTVILGEIYD